MPVDTVEIIGFVSRLSEDERLRVTVNQSLKGGLIAGGMAVVGGLLGGPAGIAVGGTVGSCLGAVAARDFKPVHEVIAVMDQEKKDALAENVRRIMASVDVTDVAMLGVLLAGDLSVKNKVIYALVDFFRNELSMAIADH